jgi:hypothetical protein
MKRTLFHLLAFVLLHSALHAGSEGYSSKDTAATQPCPSWYADREWNVSLWGTYAFPLNGYPTLQNFGTRDRDNYLQSDHAWGGGVDAKYFFARYFGLGIEGYALDVRQSYAHVFIPFFGIGNGGIAETAHDKRAVGGLLGTLTLRYPIRCSRVAPYIFAGGGTMFGGGQTTTAIAIPDGGLTVRSGSTTKAVGQLGGGFEVRLTPHIGLINDFTWNIVSGRDNNFGMARTGINFAF